MIFVSAPKISGEAVEFDSDGIAQISTEWNQCVSSSEKVIHISLWMLQRCSLLWGMYIQYAKISIVSFIGRSHLMIVPDGKSFPRL